MVESAATGWLMNSLRANPATEKYLDEAEAAGIESTGGRSLDRRAPLR